MSMRRITLKEPDKEYEIKVNPENPFIKFLRVKHYDNLNQIEVIEKSKSINDGKRKSKTFKIKDNGEINKTFNPSPGHSVFVHYLADKNDSTQPQVLEYDLIDRLDIGKPTYSFNEHISDPRNIKILFSAPFGQGKTTFLDYYFSENSEQYRVFKLFPVNYAVAANEDIFKYIKCEILFQLLQRHGDQFEHFEFSFFEKIPFFVQINIEKIGMDFIKSISKIGNIDSQHISKALKWFTKYKDYSKKVDINEGADAYKLIQELTKNEGSIFEDDFYTQLIRELLERLRVDDPQKENILIIDDLDRMDPEHIFRILNVFSAHYDTFHQGETVEATNKFGFDRIILVCDYHNLRHIFHHKFGPETQFDGYISKYYSTNVFEYSNAHVVNKLIEEINQTAHSGQHSSEFYRYFEYVAGALVNAGFLKLRDVLKFDKNGLIEKRELLFGSKEPLVRRKIKQGIFYPIIALLSDANSPEVLKSYVERLHSDHVPFKINLDQPCIQLLDGLRESIHEVYYAPKGKPKIKAKVNKHNEYDFITNLDIEDDQGRLTPVKAGQLHPYGASFSFEDFRRLLIQNIANYDSIKHLLK